MPINEFFVTLEKTQQISPKVRHFWFNLLDDALFDFLPGQFISVYLERDGQFYRRSYSIASPPLGSSSLEIAVSEVPGGLATEHLFNLDVGDSLKCSGPYGRFILPQHLYPNRYVLIATGTGVTPYRSMLVNLSKLLQEKHISEVLIMLGVQDREHNIYTDDFLNFAHAHDGASFLSCYSQEKPQTMLYFERMGRVQKSLGELSLCAERDVVYLCGAPGMVDEVFKILQEKGFGTQNVRREKYLSSK